MSDAAIDAILAGTRPSQLPDQQTIAYQVARMLTERGVLPNETHQTALAAFGQKGTQELIYLVGHYCLVSMTLNGFDVPV